MNLSPAKMVHKVWWIIYAWLGCFVAFQLFPFERFEKEGKENALVDQQLQRNEIIRGPETEFYKIKIRVPSPSALFGSAETDPLDEHFAKNYDAAALGLDIEDGQNDAQQKYKLKHMNSVRFDVDNDIMDELSDTDSEYTVSRGCVLGGRCMQGVGCGGGGVQTGREKREAEPRE